MTRRKTFLADWLRQHMPSRDEMAENRWLQPIAHRFLAPELWRFTRRSVPRGVALGIFAGFIIPVGQIFLAAFLALPARANVPVATAVTFVTNPFTFAFWLLVANRLGAVLLQIDGFAGREGSTWLAQWIEIGGVTAFGFIVLAFGGAFLGYLVTSLMWRIVVTRRRATRLAAMERRMDARLAHRDK